MLYILKSQLHTGGRSVGTGLCLSPCLTLLAISISIMHTTKPVFPHLCPKLHSH